MIVYNVTVNIDNEVEERWVSYMKNIHIPDVMETGCFTSYLFTRILSRQEDETGMTYSIQYRCDNLEKYDEYQREFAARLQEEHTQLFNGKFVAFRTLLQEVD